MGYWLAKAIIGPLLRIVLRPRVENPERIPLSGRVILAGNHTSFIDNFLLPLVFPRKVTFLAKSDYFTGKGVKGRCQAFFFRNVGQIPIDRAGGAASQAALTTGLQVLKDDGILALFPEGTRSPDGRLYRGKTGIARMALESGAEVVPVGIIGMFELQPAGRMMPKFGRVTLRIGKPLDFSRYAGMEDDRFVLRSITDEIMYELMLLSGQEYVDTYATKAKAEIELARSAAAEALVSDAPRPQRKAS